MAFKNAPHVSARGARSELLLLLPFAAGIVLRRLIQPCYFEKILSFFPVSLILLIFLSSSVYGSAVTPLLFVYFGFCGACIIAPLSFSDSVFDFRNVPLWVLPWFSTVFCTGYLGICNVCRISNRSVHASGFWKSSLATNFFQLAFLLSAYVCSCLLET